MKGRPDSQAGGALWFRLELLVGFLLVGFAVYGNALHSPFIWDDPYLILDNHLIRDFRYLPDAFRHHLYYSTAGISNFYRPLQTLFLMVDYSLWGLRPFGYHLTSLLFHIGCAFLVFLLIDLLFHRRWVALGTALLFLVHPINSTVVDYISSRADSQAALFMLISVWLFFRAPASLKRGPVLCAGSLLAFVAALLSKEMAMALPLWIAASAAILDRRLIRRTLPFFAVLAAYILLRLTVLDFSTGGHLSAAPLSIRLLTSAEAFVRLVGSLFVPVRIHIEKGIPFAVSLGEPRTWLSVLALAGIGGFMLWVRKRSPLCFFGFVWFFITLLPMSNIVPINSTLADHWLYLPSSGFFLALLGGAGDGIARRTGEKRAVLFSRPTLLRAGVAIYTAAVVLFAVVTVRQNRIWKDPVRFFETALVYSPQSFRAHNELGVIYLGRGEFDRAAKEFMLALRKNPSFDQAYDNLAVAYDKKGEFQKAIEVYQQALRLNPNNPKTYNNLGNAYLRSEQFDRAVEAYQTALRLNPTFKSVYNNLGALYFTRGEFDRAKEMWEKALRIDPHFQMAADNLRMLEKMEEESGAVKGGLPGEALEGSGGASPGSAGIPPASEGNEPGRRSP